MRKYPLLTKTLLAILTGVALAIMVRIGPHYRPKAFVVPKGYRVIVHNKYWI